MLSTIESNQVMWTDSIMLYEFEFTQKLTPDLFIFLRVLVLLLPVNVIHLNFLLLENFIALIRFLDSPEQEINTIRSPASA